MIYIERTIKIKKGEASIDEPVCLYKGDKNIEIRFLIENNPFKYKNDLTINYGQLIIKRENAPDIFSEPTKLNSGRVVFLITGDMINDLNELGNYTFQIRILNEDLTSRGTLPPVFAGITIKEPLCEEPLEPPKVIMNPEFYEIRTNGGTNYNYLFAYYSGESLDLSNWDVSNVKNIKSMFYYCNTPEVNLSGWNLNSITDMSEFAGYGCNIQKMNVSDWNTAKITNMSRMFTNSDIVSIDGLNTWDVSNVTNMSEIFASSDFTLLDLSEWDTSNVTEMYRMFYYSKATEIKGIENFNTSNVTSMGYMFYGLIIESLDLSNWNTSKVTGLFNTFFACKNLITLDISGWDTSNVTTMSAIFGNCESLKTVIGELDLTKSQDSHTSMFQNCNSLETVYLKNIYKNVTMTNASKWSINLGATKVKDECLVYIINELPNLYDKGLTATDKIIFTLPKTNTLTAEQVQIAVDKGWSVANTTC